MINNSFRETLAIASESIGLEMLTPKDCFKKALVKLEQSKEFNDSFFKNHHINQAIKYLKLGIEKC
jgi:hypothetical protein